MLAVVHTFQQPFGQWKNVVQALERPFHTHTAGDLGEVVELHFQREGIPFELFGFQPVGEFTCHMIQLDDE